MGLELCSIATLMGIAAGVIDRAISACDSLSAKIKLAKSHPEFLRAGIKFLTLKRSPNDFVTMMNRLVQCRCDFGQTGMQHLHAHSGCRTHGRLSDGDSDFVFDAVTTVIQCIILALSGLSQHKFRAGNSSGDEQPWPQGPEDLLPFGPKDSVAGLDLWVVLLPHGYTIFSLAGRLATFYAPFAVEIFQNFTFALLRPFQHLKALITIYHEDDSSPLARERFLTSPINQILQFLDNLLQVDPVRYRRMIVVRGAWLKPILAPLTTILSSQPSEPLWNRTRMLVNFLNSYANGKLDPNTGVPLVNFDLNQFTEVFETLDLHEQAFYLMRETRKLGCCNLHCPSQTEAIHPRLCSRCNLVRFCGKKVRPIAKYRNLLGEYKSFLVSKGCLEFCSAPPQDCLPTDSLSERGSWWGSVVTYVGP